MVGVALMTLLVFALVGQAAWLATDAWREREPVESPTARRVIDYTRIAWETPQVDSSSILRHQRLSRFPWLENVLTRFDVAERLTGDLRTAGVRIQPAEFLFIQLVITTAAGFTALLALPELFDGLLPAVGAGVLGFMVPIVWLRKARTKRVKQFDAQLPNALDLLVGSLRAGYTTPDAIGIVSREDSGVCAEEFAEVVQELNLGADLDAALGRLLDRVRSEDARLLVAAIGVQRRTGGNLVDVLKQLGRTLRERRRLRDEVGVLTTQPRVSSYVVAAIPPVILLSMYFVSRRSFDVLVTDPAGRIALIVSTGLVVLGLFLSSRVAKVDI
jgi:tight adherence protein B